MKCLVLGFNPYFTGLPILIKSNKKRKGPIKYRFNPYFTGLPILIDDHHVIGNNKKKVQSLFYWITYSYSTRVI